MREVRAIVKDQFEVDEELDLENGGIRRRSTDGDSGRRKPVRGGITNDLGVGTLEVERLGHLAGPLKNDSSFFEILDSHADSACSVVRRGVEGGKK